PRRGGIPAATGTLAIKRWEPLADMETRTKPQRGWFSLAPARGTDARDAAVAADAKALAPHTRSTRSIRMEAIARTQHAEPARAQAVGSRIGELLLKQGVITAADLRLAMGRLRESGGALTTYVVKHCGVSESELLTVLQE